MRRMSRVLPMLGFLLAGSCASASGQGRPRATPPEDAPPAQQPKEPPTIQVTGSASMDIPADRARVSLAVESREKTAQAASQANAATMTAVLSALRAAGFKGLEIHTWGYTLSPVYTSVVEKDGSRSERINGYRAVNNVRATLADLSAVGRLIDTATQAGANRISDISFEASDTHEAQQKVLTEAVHRAREQARTMAAALDRELGPPVEVTGGSRSPSPRPPHPFAVAGLRMEAQTPVEAADQTVTASVTITFALGPERTSR